MSAYIQSKTHIDALVTLVRNGPLGRPISPGDTWYPISYGNPTRSTRDLSPIELGELLIAENIKSVQYRYHGEAVDTLPGPIDKSSLLDYRYVAHDLSAIDGLMAIDGYEYQACEHPDWERSDAYEICNQLRRALVSTLPGYRESEAWSIDDPSGTFVAGPGGDCATCGRMEANHDRRFDLSGAPLLCLA